MADGGADGGQNGVDAASGSDAGTGTADAGAGMDAGEDETDAGEDETDAGEEVDAGSDAGSDAGPTSPTGTLDPTFGAGGTVTVDFGFADGANAVALQPDGKIIVVGDADGGVPDFAVTRLLPDGSLDTTFGDDGTIIFTFGSPPFGGHERAYDVAVDSSGKIVIVGMTDAPTAVNDGSASHAAIARLNPDGTFDTTFNGTGLQTLDLPASTRDQLHAVAIQADGKIVAAGFNDGGLPDFAIVRLNPDGSLDGTFNSNGIQSFSFGAGFGGHEQVNDLAIQADGKIVVVGFTDEGTPVTDGSQRVAAIARLNTDGSLDATFDGDGLATVDFPNGANDQFNAVVIQPDGRIIAAGYNDGGLADFAIARFNTDGSLDTTFSADGWHRFTFGAPTYGGEERCQDLALQHDGAIVLVGYTNLTDPGEPFDVAIARLDATGALDTTFGTDGLLSLDEGGNERAFGVVIQPDGAIVVAGHDGTDFVLHRIR